MRKQLCRASKWHLANRDKGSIRVRDRVTLEQKAPAKRPREPGKVASCTASRAVPAAPLPWHLPAPLVPSVYLAVPPTPPLCPRSSLLRSGSGGGLHPHSAFLLCLPWAAKSSSATKGVAYTSPPPTNPI